MSEAKSAQRLTKCNSAFQLTINEENVVGDVLNYIRSLKPNYLIACKEKAPTTGHVHFHVYVQFERSKRLSIKKLLGAHVEGCKGSPQQNIDYIKKDGEIIAEEGEPKKKGGKTIQDVKKMAKEERETLPIQLYNIVNKINNEEKKQIKGTEYYKEVEVYWYYGESGSGKSRRAVKEIGDAEFNEVKYDGTFWHGVTEECPIALYDDWRDSHMKPTELINFIDYHRHIMNVKGGSVRNNYKKIYITTLQNPEEIYKNCPEETRKQWLRRIKEIIYFQLEILPNA